MGCGTSATSAPATHNVGAATDATPIRSSATSQQRILYLNPLLLQEVPNSTLAQVTSDEFVAEGASLTDNDSDSCSDSCSTPSEAEVVEVAILSEDGMTTSLRTASDVTDLSVLLELSSEESPSKCAPASLPSVVIVSPPFNPSAPPQKPSTKVADNKKMESLRKQCLRRRVF